MFNYPHVSPGEEIAHLLYSDFARREFVETPYVNTSALPLGIGFDHFAEAARALFTLRNLILHASYIIETVDWNYELAPKQISNSLLEIGLAHLDTNRRLARLTTEAVRASRHAISPRVGRAVYNFVERKHSFCYICGEDFKGNNITNRCTLDHLWPQSLGGDSIEENLLPACPSCNSDRKRSIAHWSSTPIHALHLGTAPSREAIASVEWPLKWSVQCRAVFTTAVTERINLKLAFQKVGPLQHPWDVEYIEPSHPGHFFNFSTESI